MDFFAFKFFKFNWFFFYAVSSNYNITNLIATVFINCIHKNEHCANWSQVTHIHVIVWVCCNNILSVKFDRLVNRWLFWSIIELVIQAVLKNCNDHIKLVLIHSAVQRYGFDDSVITTLTSILYRLWWTYCNNDHFPVDLVPQLLAEVVLRNLSALLSLSLK